MSMRKELPDSYFEDKEFLIDEIDEEKVLGILGKNPSADQLLKFGSAFLQINIHCCDMHLGKNTERGH